MIGRSDFIHGLQKTENQSQWKWKDVKRRRRNEQSSISRFIEDNRRKIEEAIVGPGAGVGVGCGVGVGFGLVGGIGYSADSGWDSFRMAFGVGMGCGAGVGIGYGNGVGSGISLESLKSRLFKPKPVPKQGAIIYV